MRNSPRSLLPPPKADAAPAASHAGWQSCRRTPLSSPPAQGPCRATPREVNQLVQHANLLEAAHEAAAGCESTDLPPLRSRDAPPRPDLTPTCPTLGLLWGKCLVSRMAGQGQRCSSCPLHLPVPVATLLCPARAQSCSHGASPLGAPSRTGSSQKERLPSFPSAARPVSPNASLPLRTGALLQPGGAGMEGMQEILQGPVYFGWLTSLLSYCSQKLWEGD